MAYTTIKKPSDYFNTKLYTGNGSTQSITGVNFQPDLIWIKNRTSAYSHRLVDVVRGATKDLRSNETSAEATSSLEVQSFDSDGFTVVSDVAVNQSSANLVSWNWLASNTTASNTDGSITSTVSVNTTSGFSIVTWSASANADVGHGLGGKPDFIVTKSRSYSAGWVGWHSALTGGNEYDRYIYLDQAQPSGTVANYWLGGGSGITSTTFGLYNNGYDNNNGNMVAYCFRSIPGFSKFGSYIGNGSTDGTFVYTGFKPALLIVKLNGLNSWDMYDSTRNTYNAVNQRLYANSTSAESPDPLIDFLSNGFKIRDTLGANNTSGSTYFYACFAEEPLVGDNPATAR